MRVSFPWRKAREGLRSGEEEYFFICLPIISCEFVIFECTQSVWKYTQSINQSVWRQKILGKKKKLNHFFGLSFSWVVIFFTSRFGFWARWGQCLARSWTLSWTRGLGPATSHASATLPSGKTKKKDKKKKELWKTIWHSERKASYKKDDRKEARDIGWEKEYI